MTPLIIYTAESRITKTWRETRLSWDELAQRLATPRRANLSSLDYWQGDKALRDKVKDVGGFVGGCLQDGLRRKGAVLYRTLLTLDIDSGDASTLETLTTELDGYAYVIYSTMSHTEAKPRYRVVMPLSRHASADEYEALARKVAERTGLLEAYDDTTYQPERLMYWPCVCSDAPYVYRRGDGDPVDVDATLDEYTAWQDVSQWPHSERIQVVVRATTQRLADPCEKPGIIGAFCRVYSISRAVSSFLADVYRDDTKPYDHEGRYTYLGGSAVRGVVVYDDRVAYSHHGTDPASGQALNAYDLVRVHRFGHLDAGTSATVRIDRRPSSRAMDQWAMTLQDVRTAVVATQVEPFAGVTIPAPQPGTTKPTKPATQHTPVEPSTAPEERPDSADWLATLELGAKGAIASSAPNVARILANDTRLAGRFYYDVFRERAIITRDLPWRTLDRDATAEWTDTDDSGLRLYVESAYHITGSQKILDALAVAFEETKRHPVKQFIERARWDGIPRVESLFIDTLGAEDSILVRAMTRKSLAAAVARIYDPGCKYDQIVVLSGREGIGKSTLLRRLGGAWYNDSFNTVEGKESMEQLSGSWIIEIAELAGLKKAEVSAVKAFASKQEDSYRAAYARRGKTRPRQCVFFATTNETDFLREENGNRRFWIVPVGTHDITRPVWTLPDDYIAQVWAEALHLYRSGREQLYLEADLRTELSGLHARFAEAEDPRLGIIQDYLDLPLPEAYYQLDKDERRLYVQRKASRAVYTQHRMRQRVAVSIAEVIYECFGSGSDGAGRLDRRTSFEIGRLLRKIDGWEPCSKARRVPGYGAQKSFVRVGISEDEITASLRSDEANQSDATPF